MRTLLSVALPLCFAAPVAAAPAERTYETIYVAMCRDKPDGLAMRYGPKGVIPAHLDYIDSIRDKVAVGGPSYALIDGKKQVHGSVIAYHANNLDEAKALLSADPLYPVFASCDWDMSAAYVGTYVGGWAGPYQSKQPASK